MRQAVQLREVGALKKRELRKDREAHNMGALETHFGEGQLGLLRWTSEDIYMENPWL